MGDVLHTMGKRGSVIGDLGDSRIHWIDVAKVLAVTLVVLYHAAACMGFLFPNPSGPASTFWAGVSEVALPLRIPLFFVTAGLLAHPSLTRRWRDVLRPRVLALLWPYVLWSIAFAFIAGFAYRPLNPLGYTIGRLQGLPFATSAYWFLLMLPVFFVLAKLLRRGAWIVLAVALGLAVAAPWLEVHVFADLHWSFIYGATRVARYAFWYLLGCYASDLVSRAASLKPLYLVLGGGAAFVLVSWLGSAADSSADLSFVLSLAGVTAMIGVAVWASGFRGIRPVARYFAARTLPIYLIHPMLIVLIVLAAQRLGWVTGPHDALATVLTPIVAAFSIAVAVLAYDRMQGPRTSWLFSPPTRKRVDRLERASTPVR